MNILLIGDYSSLHKSLKEGLESLGHHVDLASTGDGWKKVGGQTIELYSYKSKIKIFRWLEIYFSAKKNISKMKDYDVVQIINEAIFPTIYNYKFLKRIKKQNRSMVLCGAGEDICVVNDYLNKGFRYYIYDYDDGYIRFLKHTLWGKYTAYVQNKVIKLVDAYIPTCWQYSYSPREGCINFDIISMPINTDKLAYTDNIVKDKVVILHGVNSGKKKGTDIIVRALKRIQNDFGSRVEVVIDGHMPLEQYLKLVRRANIVIDQCTGGGYGMGTIQAMSMGRVVCADAWEEFLAPMGKTVDEFPGIIVEPDEDSIYTRIAEAIEKGPQYFYETGKKARAHVEEVHDCRIAAEKFVRTWNSLLKMQNE